MPARDMDRWQVNEDGSYSRKIGLAGEQGINATEGAIEAADELGIDIADVEGSGKDGRVTKGDVEAHAAA